MVSSNRFAFPFKERRKHLIDFVGFTKHPIECANTNVTSPFTSLCENKIQYIVLSAHWEIIKKKIVFLSNRSITYLLPDFKIKNKWRIRNGQIIVVEKRVIVFFRHFNKSISLGSYATLKIQQYPEHQKCEVWTIVRNNREQQFLNPSARQKKSTDCAHKLRWPSCIFFSVY